MGRKTKAEMVKMWAIWHPDDRRPIQVENCRELLKDTLKRARWFLGDAGVERVEIRRVKPARKAKKGKAK